MMHRFAGFPVYRFCGGVRNGGANFKTAGLSYVYISDCGFTACLTAAGDLDNIGRVVILELRHIQYVSEVVVVMAARDGNFDTVQRRKVFDDLSALADDDLRMDAGRDRHSKDHTRPGIREC